MESITFIWPITTELAIREHRIAAVGTNIRTRQIKVAANRTTHATSVELVEADTPETHATTKSISTRWRSPRLNPAKVSSGLEEN
jgi:hypothetical protein